MILLRPEPEKNDIHEMFIPFQMRKSIELALQ
jgi:hypothetical protein